MHRKRIFARQKCIHITWLLSASVKFHSSSCWHMMENVGYTQTVKWGKGEISHCQRRMKRYWWLQFQTGLPFNCCLSGRISGHLHDFNNLLKYSTSLPSFSLLSLTVPLTTECLLISAENANLPGNGNQVQDSLKFSFLRGIEKLSIKNREVRHRRQKTKRNKTKNRKKERGARRMRRKVKGWVQGWTTVIVYTSEPVFSYPLHQLLLRGRYRFSNGTRKGRMAWLWCTNF